MRRMVVNFVTVLAVFGAPILAAEPVTDAVITEHPVAVPDVSQYDRCEGNGCDAYLPVVNHVLKYEDVKGQKRLHSALGGLSGILIGDEIAGAPGAIAFGALGAAMGYHVQNKERWEKDAKRYQAVYLRGDNISYNPANRIPANPHWMMMGPAGPVKK